MKKYYIHDNGSRPFMVIDDPSTSKIQVYVIDEESMEKNKKPNYVKKIYETKYKKIFIGTDKYKISPYWAPDFKGNSILVNVSGHKYVFVGKEICEFTAKDDILEFYSPVGNSDYPYPYGIGTNYTYLFAEYVHLNNNFLPNKKEDPYKLYYFQESNIKNQLNVAMKRKIKKEEEINILKLKLTNATKLKKSAKKIIKKTLVKRFGW